MHYRNGREAQNGDHVVQFDPLNGKAVACGQLQNAVPGNDFCNGQIVITSNGSEYGGPALITMACLCDCIHVDDLAAILAEKGLDKRPEA